MFFDPLYLILVMPALILSMYAQAKVKGAFNKYSKVRASSGKTGADVAAQMLRHAGIHNVRVEMINRELGDHYDPKAKAVRLSPNVYSSNSLAALGIAAHEVGHAIQDHTQYSWLTLRNSIIPISNFGSQAAIPLFLLGILFGLTGLMYAGIVFFALAVLFQVVTMPVETNASRRALYLLESGGYITREETKPVKSVLSAAALTYLAALLTALMQLLYLIISVKRND